VVSPTFLHRFSKQPRSRTLSEIQDFKKLQTYWSHGVV